MSGSQETGGQDQAQCFHAGELVPSHFDIFRSLAISYANGQRGAPVVDASLFRNPTRATVAAWITSTDFLRQADQRQPAMIEKADFEGRGIITLGRLQKIGLPTAFRLIVWNVDKQKVAERGVPAAIVAAAVAADSSPLCAALANDQEFLLVAAKTLSPLWQAAVVEVGELDDVCAEVKSGKKTTIRM